MNNREIIDTLIVLGELDSDKDYYIIDTSLKRFVHILKDNKKNLRNCIDILYWVCYYLDCRGEREIVCDDLYNLLVIYKKYMNYRLSKMLNDMSLTMILVKKDFNSIRLHLRRKRIDLVSNYNHFGNSYKKYGIEWNNSLWVLVKTNADHKEFVSENNVDIINDIGFIELLENDLVIHHEKYAYDRLVEILEYKRDRVFLL